MKNRVGSIFAVIISLFLTISGCTSTGSDPDLQQISYNVSISALPAEGGTVKPESGEHEEGTSLDITANPSEGWRFDHWKGDYEGESSPATVTVNQDMDIEAVFIKQEFTLDVQVEGEGSVSEQVIKTKDYEYQTQVKLTAQPEDGWAFKGWEGDITGSENPVTVEINNSKTITAVFGDPFAGGDGTKANPYKISTIEQLQQIQYIDTVTDYTNDHFIQINDIDASETASWNRDEGFIPLTLGGSYDGQGYTISNLTVNRSRVYNNGLFGSLQEGAEIKNVTLVEVDIKGGNSTGGLVGVNLKGRVYDSQATGKVNCSSNRCGGLVGDNYGRIENSSADVEVISTADDVGGLVGLNWASIIQSFAVGHVTGVNSVGGLVGEVYNPGDERNNQISRSYAQGKVTGSDDVGGLIGFVRNNAFISSSYATGEVTSNAVRPALGGLVGRVSHNAENSVVHTSYWDTVTTGQDEAVGSGSGNSGSLIGLSTSQMTGEEAKANMGNLDFPSVWNVISDDYPVLFWQ